MAHSLCSITLSDTPTLVLQTTWLWHSHTPTHARSVTVPGFGLPTLSHMTPTQPSDTSHFTPPVEGVNEGRLVPQRTPNFALFTYPFCSDYHGAQDLLV